MVSIVVSSLVFWFKRSVMKELSLISITSVAGVVISLCYPFFDKDNYVFLFGIMIAHSVCYSLINFSYWAYLNRVVKKYFDSMIIVFALELTFNQIGILILLVMTRFSRRKANDSLNDTSIRQMFYFVAGFAMIGSMAAFYLLFNTLAKLKKMSLKNASKYDTDLNDSDLNASFQKFHTLDSYSNRPTGPMIFSGNNKTSDYNNILIPISEVASSQEMTVPNLFNSSFLQNNNSDNKSSLRRSNYDNKNSKYLTTDNLVSSLIK